MYARTAKAQAGSRVRVPQMSEGLISYVVVQLVFAAKMKLTGISLDYKLMLHPV